MDYDYYSKKSGQIPAFGNWEYANDLPITQYFESARQAGLLRYSCSDELDLYSAPASDFLNAPRPKSKKRNAKGRNREGTAADQTRRKGSNLERPARKMEETSDSVCRPNIKIVNIVPKPVDEDLYKIPPELLRTSKKRKMLRFLTSCLLPNCSWS